MADSHFLMAFQMMSDRNLRALDMRHTLPNLKNLLLTLTDGEGAPRMLVHSLYGRSIIQMTSCSFTRSGHENPWTHPSHPSSDLTRPQDHLRHFLRNPHPRYKPHLRQKLSTSLQNLMTPPHLQHLNRSHPHLVLSPPPSPPLPLPPPSLPPLASPPQHLQKRTNPAPKRMVLNPQAVPRLQLLRSHRHSRQMRTHIIRSRSRRCQNRSLAGFRGF